MTPTTPLETNTHNQFPAKSNSQQQHDEMLLYELNVAAICIVARVKDAR